MNLYTTGQVAYHGTKLVGGSEEDAQSQTLYEYLGLVREIK